MTKEEEGIWHAAQYGDLPPGTTTSQLASIKHKDGWSALHVAAAAGQLPLDATAQELADTKTNCGLSALHVAAKWGRLPTDITTQTLAATKDRNLWSALHIVARNGHLPSNITAALLKETHDNRGYSAWHALCQFIEHNPNQIIQLPHQIFTEDHTMAITTANQAIQKDPNLANKVTIWLGQVLAAKPSQHDQTIRT